MKFTPGKFVFLFFLGQISLAASANADNECAVNRLIPGEYQLSVHSSEQRFCPTLTVLASSDTMLAYRTCPQGGSKTITLSCSNGECVESPTDRFIINGRRSFTEVYGNYYATFEKM